jgi:hypothetical protein
VIATYKVTVEVTALDGTKTAYHDDGENLAKVLGVALGRVQPELQVDVQRQFAIKRPWYEGGLPRAFAPHPGCQACQHTEFEHDGGGHQAPGACTQCSCANYVAPPNVGTVSVGVQRIPE